MYKAAIFDLDGTIADTLESMALAGNKVLKECGLLPRSVEEYKYYAGDGARELVKRFLAAAGDEEGRYFEQAYASYQKIFEADCTYKVKPYEGIREMLAYLKLIGVKTGVLSNKPHKRAVTVVETLFGKAYFDIILGQQEDLKRKPDPEGALLIAENFGVQPSACLYVGDTDVDMKTGNRAGMYTAGVLWGFRDRQELEENNAHVLVKEPKDLLRLFV